MSEGSCRGFDPRRAILFAALSLGFLLFSAPAYAQGVLDVEIINAYNLVIDSNSTSPSTYAPSAGYIGARVCNTGNASLANVTLNTGDYNGGVGSTPGIFPVHDSTGDLAHPQITNTGNYSLTLEAGVAGTADGSRFIGTLAAGECRVMYWLITYPQCVNVSGSPDEPPCAGDITGGVGPEDDLSLDYDVWATTTSAIAQPSVNVSRDFTLRNEISASANKIWPNTTSKVPDEYLAAIQALIGWGTLGPDGQPLSPSNPVYPGQRVITTQGIWYDLGNVNKGFDNDGDLVPDQNAWLQPVGDASVFDPACFRMVSLYGILIVKLKSGGELLIPFQNELYFEHIPDNTGVVGLVYYQFIATDTGCSAAMTPYQESASGFDNEKFSADFGLSVDLTSGDPGAGLTLTKTDGVATTTTGSTLTYTVSATNTSGANLGAPDLGVPLIIKDAIPAGTTFVAGSADDTPASNLTEPTGTGSYTQGFTDYNAQLDTCTINYNITSASWTVFYSTDDGATWTLTEPPAASVTHIQWILFTTLALDGGHDGLNCIVPDGTYDNGTLQTSFPTGQTIGVSFQVTVDATAGPVVCNYVGLGFNAAANAREAQDCTLVAGNNTLSGAVFKDDGVTGGTYGNGTRDGTEAGIGAGVSVSLYYDFNGDGVLDGGDLLYGTTTTSAAGAYSFTSLPDGPFLVVVKKYDGSVSDGIDNAVNDAAFGTTGWGNTTTDPTLPLSTNQGVLKMSEDTTTVVLAVNIDLGHTTGVAQTVSNVNFGFAPPLRLTKVVSGNADLNLDGRADTAIDEGDVFSYAITLENRLPSVGKQGPTGCQYTVWATTGANGTPATKEFTNPTNAWDGPNRTLASALVTGGGLRFMDGTGFGVRTQAGNITKVEALYMGYFSAILTDDTLFVEATLGGNTSNTTFSTALIDSYVGEPASLDPNSAISWDITSAKPGGGAWSFADSWSTVRLLVNPTKASSADQKTFYLDSIGVRITTDQNCVAGESTTLSPVPLQDTYDTSSFAFISASPVPNSVNTATGVIQWDDVGPILPGSTQTVTVTMRALNVSGTRTGTCASGVLPTSACNAATTAFGSNHAFYADGRQANDSSDDIAVTLQGKGELRGTVWQDTNVDGWPNDDGEPGVPNVTITLWGCVRADGVTMETGTNNKTCANATNGNFWTSMGTTTTSSTGAYEFIGLDTGYYIVEVGDTNGAPGTGSAAPYGGTQTAEPNDTQAASGGNAVGTNGVCAVNCNNNWGWGASESNISAMNLLNSPTAEEIIGGINFGYNIPNAVVYGNIWWDVDGDTVTDPGDTGLSGFTVQIYSDPNGDGNPADGTLQATTTTDSNGNYSFSGLAAASYVIVVTPPTLLNKAWVETIETTGGTTSLNNQIPVTVTAGQLSGSHNFGYTQADTSSIGDTLFYDFDEDGVQDPTEAGIPNVTVLLYEDVDRDGVIDAGVDNLVASTSTDASGNYLFTGLAAGSYIVKVDTTDPDFPTDVTPTGDPDIASGRIGDTIWLDANGNGVLNAGEDGIAGVIVNLYDDADGSGTLSGGDSLVASTITNVNGNYLFTGLPAGNYFVDVDESSLPSTLLALTTADPAAAMITLASSSASHLTADAGYSLAANFSIGNRIWHDVDNDGVQDPGEPGIPNIDIVITNGTGTGCAGAGCRVTTDAGGFWIVTGLTNGTFTVNVDDADAEFPRDFTATTGTTDPRTVTVAGADLTNVDFGYRFTGSGSSPTGIISGRVFLDADGDLAYDAGEERSGTTVNLIDEDGEIVATTSTAADGTYSFTGVFVGTYTIQSVDTLGTRYSTIFLSAAQTFPNLNVIYQTSIETVADSQSSVSVDGVHADLLQDFGYRRFTGSIGDSIYWDVNENATQDAGEPGFSGVTVRLYDSVWTDANGDGYYQAGESVDTLVATTTTVADDPLTAANEGGTYLFSNLSALASGHRYLVVVDTTTLPGTSHTLIGDPDTDGIPCPSLPSPDDPFDNFPPPSVCDSRQLVAGWLPGNNYLGADFGYRINGTGFATIGDQLWIDSDNDGTRDAGEPGIPGITVWLDDDNDGVLDWTDGNGNNAWDAGEGERWTETDIDGFYTFTSVADGTYNLEVLTSDPDWPSGLSTTPSFEVRASNTASRDNAVQVVVTGGAVTSIVDGDPANDPDTCTSCNLDVDFGYRYPGTNSVSGTICAESGTLNGYCGDTATTYSGVGTGESALQSVTVALYRWTDDGDNSPWDGSGVLDPGDTFTLLGTTSTDANGDYTFSGVPDNVIVVFSVNESQNLRLTTTSGNTSVEDANVITRAFYEGTTTYEGNTVTVVGRQALSIGGDVDDNIQDLDFALDSTLGGLIVYDYGDLPSTYENTLLADNGAQHRSPSGSIHLGAAITTEADGTENAAALGDADDGVTMVSTQFNEQSGAYVDVTASADGWLIAWIDFNADGDFDDADEMILDQAVTAGVNSLSFFVPDIPDGVTDFFARFRIYPSRPQIASSTGPGLDSNFQRMTGEVEDYLFVMNVSPTAVEMMSMEAKQSKNHVTVTWQTTMEADNLGFDVYRSLSGGAKEKINSNIIIGSAFMTGRKTSGPRSYRFVDRKPPAGLVQYWIEDVDLDGSRTMHGPVTPVNATTDDGEGAVITDPDSTIGSVGGIFTTPAGMGTPIPLPDVPEPARVEQQWELAAVQAVKVIVTQTGWYRVKKSDLVAAGFDPGSNGKAISVFTDGVEVPVLINAKNEAKFDSNDSIEFFGRNIDMQSTGGRVYYVTLKKGSGLRVKKTGARGNSGAPSLPSFPYTFERIERTIYFHALVNNGDAENFFGAVIGPWPTSRALTVSNLDTNGNASLALVIQGATENRQHVVQVSINGTEVGVLRFNGQERHVETLTFAAALLQAGENTLTFYAVNGWEDISTAEAIRLTYPHKYRADDDALAFTVDGFTAVTVGGFTTDKIKVIDVTDPLRPDLIDASIANESGGTKSISFSTTNGGKRTIIAFAESRVLPPAQIAYNEPSTWNNASNGASLVIITNRAFRDAANKLKATRDAQGTPTVVVDVQNVYDEFSFGHHSPQAIRDFLARTLAAWKTKPRYVVLLGDATFDPRNYLGFGSYDFVPTKMISTVWLKSSSDDWFADFGGTGIPAMAIGRIPARTAEQAMGVVDKLVARSASPSEPWAQYATVIADAPNGYPFNLAADAISQTIPGSYTIDRIDIGTTPGASAAIVSSFNRGSLLTSFIGHGSVELWSNNYFNSSTASTLTNNPRLPFVVSMNCLNGYFHDLFTNSLAEALLNNANGGAIGVWASSALSGANGQLAVCVKFNQNVFGPTPMTIGDAILRAKEATRDPDVRRTWILFGDPSMKLK
ncbi:MAG TPA: SdrD B-like domain-containing protein [Thermoanaerobaculia bacterium]|nr:SdrD B-like domain-containing protein [Thermoanaerobaculia bacterium]